jgi:hypothetical protein
LRTPKISDYWGGGGIYPIPRPPPKSVALGQNFRLYILDLVTDALQLSEMNTQNHGCCFELSKKIVYSSEIVLSIITIIFSLIFVIISC